MSLLPPAIYLMGPTAAGKTALAIEIARQFPVEIISVDSALVYRGMNIGTAKPDAATLAEFPHFLVDILDPTQIYSVGQFLQDSTQLMAQITARGNIPLLVGGTMLYFRALQQGLAVLPVSDPQVRAKIEADISKYGLASLHQRLAQVDPQAAQRIHVNDPQRLQRALEVFMISGRPMSAFFEDTHSVVNYAPINIIVAPFDRKVLHQRIADRYHAMIAAGFIDEVKSLFDHPGCHPKLPAIRAVGYRQAWSYLAGEIDQATFIERAIIATRQMAKRQITWLRAQTDAVWFNSNTDLPTQAVCEYINDCLKSQAIMLDDLR